MRYPLPYAFARTHQLLLGDDGAALTLWLSPSSDKGALSEVVRHCASEALSVAHEDAPALVQRISQAYSAQYGPGESSAAAVVSEVESEADLSRMMQELPAVEDLLETSDDAPIIRMLNALLTQAARDGASDIHIEPYERHSSVRFRVDGAVFEAAELPKLKKAEKHSVATSGAPLSPIEVSNTSYRSVFFAWESSS